MKTNPKRETPIEEMLRKIRDAISDTRTSRAIDRPSELDTYEALVEESDGWRARLHKLHEEAEDDEDDEDDDEDDEE